MAEKASKREKLKEFPRNVRGRASRVIGRVKKRFWNVDETNTEETPDHDTQTDKKRCRKESEWSEKLSLHKWQREALDWWQDNDYRGVVEAVTGAGKTRTAIAAAEHHFRNGGDCVVVIVPTTALLHQWRKEAQKHLTGTYGMEISIGLMGGGYKDSLLNSRFLIATVQTAKNKELPRVGQKALIILDEVHRYGGQEWSKILKSGFTKRLGLTATYKREDSGNTKYLDPYFLPNKKPIEIGYGRALKEEVIAHFKIAFVGVKFSPSEASEYRIQSDSIRRYKNRLIREFGAPQEPFGDFMKFVGKLAEGGEGKATGVARAYQNAFSKRQKVLSETKSKYEKVADLAEAVHAAEKTIIFTQTIVSAKRVKEGLNDAGIRGASLTSDMDADARQRVFIGFEDGEFDMVVSPKLLDEGIDISAADLGIIVASSRTRRQMIQRMGRIIRKKEDGRLARLVVLYVEGSSEDPKMAHKEFIDYVKPHADDNKQFDSSKPVSEIINYLNNWQRK